MCDERQIYVNLPKQIEACKFSGRSADAHRIVAWILDNGGRAAIRDGYKDQGPDLIEIETLEGVMIVAPDDYVIRGIEGDFYPCKPDIFEKSYIPKPKNIVFSLDMHREQTLFKVHDALAGIGYTESEITDMISVLLSAGILFREPIPE